jgi:serine protease Do
MSKNSRNLLVVIFSVLVFSIFVSSVLFAEKDEAKADKRAWLGIYMQDVTDDIAEALDLSVDEGVLINDVIDDSPAEKAGLEEGDVISKLDQKSIEDTGDLSKAIKTKQPGDKVNIEVIREGEKKEFVIELGEAAKYYDKKFSLETLPKFYNKKGYTVSRSGGYLGVTLQSLGEQLAEYFEVKEGVLISDVEKDTPAEKAGLKAGDVIVKVDDEDVESPSDVSQIIRKHEEGDKVEIAVVRKGRKMNFTAELAEREMDFNWYGSFEPHLNLQGLLGLTDPDAFNFNFDFDPDDFEGIYEFYGEDFQKEMQELKEELNELKQELKEMQRELKEELKD